MNYQHANTKNDGIIGEPLPPKPHNCGLPGHYWGICVLCNELAK